MKKLIILLLALALMLSLAACSNKKDEGSDIGDNSDNVNSDSDIGDDSTKPKGDTTPEGDADDDGNEEKPDGDSDGDDGNKENPDDDSDGDTPLDESAAALIDKLLRAEYKKITVETRTVTYGFILTSRYEITEDSVVYIIERLNSLPSNGDIGAAMQDYKSVVSGTATVQNGKLVDSNGNEVDLPELDEVGVSFSFNSDNVVITTDVAGTLSGTVKSLKDFFSNDTSATDAAFTVNYTSESVTNITLTYKLENSQVQTVYSFEK